MQPARTFPAVPRSVEESDVLRNSISQAQTERRLTAHRLDNVEAALKIVADQLQVVILENANLKETVSRLRAAEVV